MLTMKTLDGNGKVAIKDHIKISLVPNPEKPGYVLSYPAGSATLSMTSAIWLYAILGRYLHHDPAYMATCAAMCEDHAFHPEVWEGHDGPAPASTGPEASVMRKELALTYYQDITGATRDEAMVAVTMSFLELMGGGRRRERLARSVPAPVLVSSPVADDAETDGDEDDNDDEE